MQICRHIHILPCMYMFVCVCVCVCAAYSCRAVAYGVDWAGLLHALWELISAIMAAGNTIYQMKNDAAQCGQSNESSRYEYVMADRVASHKWLFSEETYDFCSKSIKERITCSFFRS